MSVSRQGVIRDRIIFTRRQATVFSVRQGLAGVRLLVVPNAVSNDYVRVRKGRKGRRRQPNDAFIAFIVFEENVTLADGNRAGVPT